MNQHEAKEQVLQLARPSRRLVALAKQQILGLKGGSPFEFLSLVNSFVLDQGITKPSHVNLNERADTETDIRNAGRAIACELAVAQAVAELAGQGRVMARAAWQGKHPNLGYTTVLGGSGGQTGGLDLEELSYAAPDHLIVSPVADSPAGSFDPDVFVLESDLDAADPGVREALADALACLAFDLYRPASAMLGSAVEGAWIELGIALAEASTAGSFDAPGFIDEMKGDQPGIARKMTDVLALYESPSLASARKGSGVSPAQLRAVYVWSDLVREARNAIHFNNPGTLANSFDKVATLLLGAQKNLPLVYAIVRTCRAS